MQTAFHLVRLLIVLVRPHVVGDSAGQRVECELFEAVSETWVAEDRERLLEREHGFDYSAEFGSL